MKYLIAIPILFLFSACNTGPGHKSQSYVNYAAFVNVENIPFNINSSKVFNSIIRPAEHQSILILTAKKLNNELYNISGKKDSLNTTKWLMIYWEQKADSVWIGARVPGKFLFADLIQFTDNDLVINRYNHLGKLVIIDKDERKKISKTILNIRQI